MTDLNALVAKIDGLTTEQKLLAAVEVMRLRRLDLAEVLVQKALEDLQVFLLFGKASPS